MTASQTIEWLNATYDLDQDDVAEDLCLDDRQRGAWHSFSRLAVDQFGGAETLAFRDHLELAWDTPRIRVEYDGQGASIRIPYCYQGDEARRALAVAYAIGRLLEVELGLEGVDGVTGIGLTADGLTDDQQIFADMGARTARLRDPQ
jgi:hypothetical protein